MCFIIWILLKVHCIIDSCLMCCSLLKVLNQNLNINFHQMDFLLKFLDIHMNEKTITYHDYCHDVNLKLMTKIRNMERCEPKMQHGSHIHTLKNESECKIMSPYTPKWAPTLGVGVLTNFQISRKQLKGKKLLDLIFYKNHWKDLQT